MRYKDMIETLSAMGISKEEYQDAARKETAPDISLMTIAPAGSEQPRAN